MCLRCCFQVGFLIQACLKFLSDSRARSLATALSQSAPSKIKASLKPASISRVGVPAVRSSDYQSQSADSCDGDEQCSSKMVQPQWSSSPIESAPVGMSDSSEFQGDLQIGRLRAWGFGFPACWCYVNGNKPPRRTPYVSATRVFYRNIASFPPL